MSTSLRIVAVPFAVILWGGCVHFSQATWKIEKPEDMRQAIIQRIPRGTSIDAARKVMESEGFTCNLKRNSTFYERTSWQTDGVQRHDQIDFLECRRTQSAGFLMSRQWTVALVLNGDLVSDVLISHILDGP
jgi:hypothetical protein